MQRIWKSKYPDVVLNSEEGGQETDQNHWTTDDGEFDFIINGHELMCSEDKDYNFHDLGISSAWSGKYKGVIGEFIKQVFETAEKKSGKHPPRRIILYTRDGSDGAWEHLASKLGADLIDNPHQ